MVASVSQRKLEVPTDATAPAVLNKQSKRKPGLPGCSVTLLAGVPGALMKSVRVKMVPGPPKPASHWCSSVLGAA